MLWHSGKVEVYDDKFFKKGSPFNQGNIFDFNEEEFISGCENAVEKVSAEKINSEGLKIQNEYTYEKLANNLLSLL